MDVGKVPVEIWDHVLSLAAPETLQATTCALLLALPHANVSRAWLYRHLNLTREEQAWQANKQLRSEPGLRRAVRTVQAEAWREDPQLLVNLLLTLDSVTHLRCAVGPLFAPEHLEELLDVPAFATSIRSIYFRFNPYVQERSYYTFLKGAYFDTTPTSIARWSPSEAPNLRQLAFCQDLPPNHGVVVKPKPAFGLHEIEEALEEIVEESPSKAVGPVLDFAQPIVFHQLSCLAILALSPVGQQLTHLILRFPRRNPLTALTAYPSSRLPPQPYPSVTTLDLSTTHIIPDFRFPSLLRLHPNLEHLILDRCTGLIGLREAPTEQPVILTLRYLGKCFGGVGSSRAEEVVRAWKKIVRERPTGIPAPGPSSDARPGAPVSDVPRPRKAGRSGYANMPRPSRSTASTSTSTYTAPRVVPIWPSELPPPVRDIFVIPPAPKGKSLGFGLFPLEASIQEFWRTTFMEGYNDALEKTADKIEEAVHRWEAWRDAGKLADGTRRMVTFVDALPPDSPWVDWEHVETDDAFRVFCQERNLVNITAAAAQEVLASIRAKTFVLCMVPDCPGSPGVPHVSLHNISKEKRSVREAREKQIWEQEQRERTDWRRPESEHQPGCAHLTSREAWSESIEMPW